MKAFIENGKLKIENSRRGVTLIELLLVISVIVIVAAMSAPFYSRFYVQNAVEDAQNNLVGSLRKAQTYSMTGKRNGGTWGVRYTSSPKRFTIYQTEDLSISETFSVGSAVTISGFTSDISFARMTGKPSSTPTITISGGNTTKTVTLTSQGGINAN